VNVSWNRVLNLTLWILQVFLAALFLYFGATKLIAPGVFWVDMFAKIGIGQWFRYFTGAVEVAGAVLLLIPKTSAIGASLLACVMAGAVLTHLIIVRDGWACILPGFPLLILVAVAWQRCSLFSR
jgi:putative oxidoreductase